MVQDGNNFLIQILWLIECKAVKTKLRESACFPLLRSGCANGIGYNQCRAVRGTPETTLPRKKMPVPRFSRSALCCAIPAARRPRYRVAALAACACLSLGAVLARAERKGEKERQGTGNREQGTATAQPPIPVALTTNHQPPATNDVRIETFAAERGYVVGAENAVLLCVVRNMGSAPLPENLLRLRCYPISGLDYTNGNLLPVLPALAPGQAVAYRWRFAPSEGRSALVAGVVLEKAEQGAGREQGTGNREQNTPTPNTEYRTPNTQLAFAVVPRLPRPLTLGDVPVIKDTLAHAGEQGATSLLLNSRVAARVQMGERRETGLVLGVKDGAGWRSVAGSLVPLRVCVGEDGQSPWWQTFRCQQVRSREDKTSATLTLTGSVGNACRAEITLESRPDTCVLNGKVHFTALRPLRLSGIQLPALQTVSDDKTLPVPRADGSPSLLPEPAALIPDDARLAAGRNGGVTFGVAWPSDPPFPAWKWSRLPLADGLVTFVLGAQAVGEGRGDTLAAGSSIEIPFHWFAFAPSDTIRDATRFQMP